ncbi:MAG: hypothetical protein KVP17_001613 [Porospora cf. gigantea B]|uniref:uncharacterized protein n=1 Tax=Porospora cf. gigantea B TaxID=2853592 RepID=UPI003571E9EB|nr:MAG: hypothetical protein KVP17_001613 [Porospora cf. gigantea B]
MKVVAVLLAIGRGACPAGVSEESGLCVPDCVGIGCVQVVERQVPAVMCSSGFSYEGLEGCCVMDEETEAQYICPDGSPSDGYVCTRTTKPVFTCEEDFSLEDGSCIRHRKDTMDAQCPYDSKMDGLSCLEKIPVELVPECPVSCYKEGDQCFTNKTFAHSLMCPPGWTLDGGRCVMSEMVDCTDKTLPGEGCGPHCYIDMQCSGEKCFASRDVIQQRIAERKGKRFLGSATADVCSTQPCKVSKMTKKADSSSLELVSKTCLRRTETDPEIFCEGPAEAVFNGKECCVQIPVPPVYKCPVLRFGATDDECYRLKRRPAQYICPPGFEQKCRSGSAFPRPATCQCVAVDHEPSTPVCPEGSALHDGLCVLFEEPVAYCADEGATLDGQVCVRTIREPVRMRTTITLECLGERCFDKLKSEIARANLLPSGLDGTPSPDVEDVEIVTKKLGRRRGRRCEECPAHLETVEEL